MNRIKVLLTGGTGFLGKYVFQKLSSEMDVVLLSRQEGKGIKGDLRQWNAGVALNSLCDQRFDVLLHLAGLYDLYATAQDCNLTNVVGAGVALRLAQKLGIPLFINASSVAAAINSPLSRVTPYDLNFSRPFPDPYSETKALAEQALKNWEGVPLNRINLRLGILVGATSGDAIQRIDGPYHSIEAFRKMSLVLKSWPRRIPLLLPGQSKTRLPLVPVDVAAQAIGSMVSWAHLSKSVSYRSFHLVPNEGLSILDLYQQALKHLGYEGFELRLTEGMPKSMVSSLAETLVQFPEKEMAYLLNFPQYDNDLTNEVLGSSWCPAFSSYQDSFWRGYENYIQNR